MLSRGMAQKLATEQWGVNKAKVYVNNDVIEYQAQEVFYGENTEEKYFAKSLEVVATIEGTLHKVEFYKDTQLIWTESYEKDLNGDYKLKVLLIFPYE